MGQAAPRAALWALVLLLLVGGLAGLPGARASSTPTYTLFGWVEQPGTEAPVPAGVTVDLVSQATGQTFTALTQQSNGVPSGQFIFTASNTGGALGPGWWGLVVPPQAKLHLAGSACNPCAILPQTPIPVFSYYNATDLTTVGYPMVLPNVTALAYNTTIFGNATNGANPAVNASVQLIDPQHESLVLANATTNSTGAFNFTAPWGDWVLKTTLPSSPSRFDYQSVAVAGTRMTVNPSITTILTYGHVNQMAHPSAHVPNGGNATVIDLATEASYVYPVPPGGFYAIGGYPANFTGPGAEAFDVILSLVGYAPTWYEMNVTSASTPVQHDVLATAIAPPANYTTNLDFSRGFSNLSVNSTALLSANSVFPKLPNASVGQLWSQLALDLSHNLTFSSGDLPTVYAWVESQGPFFPAAQAGTTVNGVSFGANTTFGFTPTSTCAGGCGLNSTATMGFGWKSVYNVTSTVGKNLQNYTLAFSYKHPSNAQSMNYTVTLPSGYVLSAGTPAPAGATLDPAGPNGTWTKFTVVSKPYTSASSTATLPIVKFGNVTAIVNISSSNFAYSSSNVLNSTINNYTVVASSGENLTFSAANSTFPSGTNGTLYHWMFGDSSTPVATSDPTTYHTYAASGAYNGTLTLTSSGGRTSTANFTVYAGNTAPVAKISVNATVVAAGSASYVMVNWSSTLHFNASTSSSTLYAGAPVAGVLSIANWSLQARSFSTWTNFTAGSGIGNPAQQNYTYTFKGAGLYLTSTTVGNKTVDFLGWRYNVTLSLYDAGGRPATASLVVLVRDTQKPTPQVAVQDASGRTVTGSAVVEAANRTAEVQLVAANSTDPNNGSLVSYNWSITNSGNSSVGIFYNQTNASGYKIPARPIFWLAPQSSAYTVNLTVWDRAGNTAYVTATVSISPNASTRPVLTVSNLTAPTTMQDQGTYTVWANVTNTLGQNSTAQNVSVRFYLLSPSGSGSPIAIGGSPGSVKFYNYTSNTTTSASPFAVGLARIAFNETVRAEITFSPARVGTYDLWVNATASNEFASNYATGANQAHVSVTLNANPIVFDEEVIGVVAGVVIVIVAALLYFRRARGGGRKASGSGAGSKSGLERPKKGDDEGADKK